MAQDDFMICEIVVSVVFGAVLVTIVGLGIFNCVQRKKRMTALRNECDEVAAMAEEKQQKLNWITGVNDLADNESLFGDDSTSTASFSSRGSRGSRY